MAKKKPKPPPADPWTEEYIQSLAVDEKEIKEARKVLTKGGFGKVESRADGLGWFVECQGMTGKYQVSVRPDPATGFDATCTCPSRQRPCKHTLALLLYLAAHPEERIAPTAASSAKSADLDALVRAVFDNPDDDTPRLVLADCAEELGQRSRAALIRLQCEKARLKPTDARYKELDAAEKALMPAVREEMGSIPDNTTATFHRGFLTLRTEGGWWDRDLDALPAKFPELFRDGWVEVVSLAYAHSIPSWLYGLLRQVREVDFSRPPSYSDLQDRDLVQIASELRPGLDGVRLKSVVVPNRHQARFRELVAAASGETPGTGRLASAPPTYTDLSGFREFRELSPAQFGLLARAGHLHGARTLTLYGEIGDEGIRTLLATSGLDDLTSLNLTASGIGPDGVRDLAASPFAGRLQQLNIFGARDGDGIASALREVAWPRLGDLALSAAGLTDAGADTLSRCDFPALTALALHDNAITRDGAALLLESAKRAGVKDWRFFGNPIAAAEMIPLVVGSTRAGAEVRFAQVMAEMSHAPTKSNEFGLQLTGLKEPAAGLFDEWADAPRPLVRLTLAKLRFDASEIEKLVAALAACGVRELHINECELRNEGATALAKHLAAVKLEVLDLSDNGIGKAGAEALAASPGLATVRVLRLGGNPLRPSGVDAIAASPHLKALERIALPGKDIAPKRQKDIRAKFGKGVAVEF